MSAAVPMRDDRTIEEYKKPKNLLTEATKGLAPDTPIEIWFQDEARVGQKNGLVYQWAKKGTRPGLWGISGASI